jgi:hypothetical protein
MSPPFFCHLSVLSKLLLAMAPTSKSRRGLKFTVAKLEHLLKVVEEVFPIGNPEWEKIWQEHSSPYPTQERTAELLKRKFLELA